MVRYIPRIDQLTRKVVRAHVEQNFSVGVMAKNYTRVYKRVIVASLPKSSQPKVTVKKPVVSVSSSSLRTPALGFKTDEAVQGLSPQNRAVE
jgi:hypothetical protein